MTLVCNQIHQNLDKLSSGLIRHRKEKDTMSCDSFPFCVSDIVQHIWIENGGCPVLWRKGLGWDVFMHLKNIWR